MPKTILLADDSVTIQKVVELTFMDGDYEVVAVSNGDEAIARLDADHPDFVIADVHMPGADGYAVCEHSRELYPQVPSLLLVGTFEPFDEQRAGECGAGGHLKKPFDSQELLHRVEEMSRESPEAVPAAEALTHEASSLHAVEDAVEEPIPESTELAQDAPGEGATVTLPEPEAMAEEDLADEDTSVRWSGAAEGVGEAPEFSLDESDEVPATLVSPPAGILQNDGAEAALAPDAPQAESPPGSPLSEEDLERLAKRVVERLSEKVVREVAWEVVPDLAEVVIKERIRQLEAEVE